jgi:membrane associated rhomboid family serine protease
MSNDHFRSAVLRYIPVLILVSVLWGVHLYQYYNGVSFAQYGNFPRDLSGLKGVVFMHFIHADFEHLISNSIPLLVLGGALTYFYPTLYKRVFLWVMLAGGFWLWLGGRPSFHIGASGLVYGLSSFLFFSGFFRRDLRLIALSLLVVFLYGGMVWGVFPLVRQISWEGHLFGGLAGALLAWVYRNDGPQRKRYLWELEEEDDSPETGEEYWNQDLNAPNSPQNVPPGRPGRIMYIYKKQKPGQPPKDEKD